MKSVKNLLAMLLAFVAVATFAQEEEEAPKLEISGSIDTYFKYDFSGYSNSADYTSFGTEQNSVSLGMFDLAFSQEVGKASFVGEISFGPRGQYETLGNGADGNSFHIQNLYTSYAVNDKLSITAGYMGTFIGYEVISPAANFNYSSSHLFWNGPFQHAGIKADYAVSDKFAFMVGLFNDWNIYQDMSGVSDIGAQIYVSPVDGLDIYINGITGFNDDAVYTGMPGIATEFDITAGYQISDDFYLGLNAAMGTYDAESAKTTGGFSGVAIYPQYSFSDKVSLGYRGEYFMTADTEVDGVVAGEGSSVMSNTLTLNIYEGPLTFSTEFRMDSGEGWFQDDKGEAADSFSQIIFAAIYAF